MTIFPQQLRNPPNNTVEGGGPHDNYSPQPLNTPINRRTALNGTETEIVLIYKLIRTHSIERKYIYAYFLMLDLWKGLHDMSETGNFVYIRKIRTLGTCSI